MHIRMNDRRHDELRPWKMTPHVLDHAEGSVIVESGKTRVLCAATIEEKVPSFLKYQQKGWVTAEYSMLPRSTHERSPRERGTKIGGRTMEIQRLIGRSLRCVTDLVQLGERTITIDCDVIQADGGTRVASISGAWVALHFALQKLNRDGMISGIPLSDSVSAVSVGILDGNVMLDLDYSEDSTAQVDMNVVVTGKGRLVEVQATGEESPFSVSQLNELLKTAMKGAKEIQKLQKEAITIPRSQ